MPRNVYDIKSYERKCLDRFLSDNVDTRLLPPSTSFTCSSAYLHQFKGCIRIHSCGSHNSLVYNSSHEVYRSHLRYAASKISCGISLDALLFMFCFDHCILTELKTGKIVDNTQASQQNISAE